MDSDQENKRIQPKLVLLSVLLSLTLLVSALPQMPAAAVTCKFKHTVEAGDTIQYLANLYSVGWEQIANANDLLPPYTITVGQVLCIPGGEKPASTTTEKKKGKEPTLDIVPQLTFMFHWKTLRQKPPISYASSHAPTTSRIVLEFSRPIRRAMLLIGLKSPLSCLARKIWEYA
jgi:LysM repeat protein